MAEILEAKEKHEDELLEYPNVVGVETGLKEVSGEETDETAIIVKVKNKVAESELDDEHIIPREIEGFKTDVLETGEIVIPPLMKTPEKERTDKWRPIPMGVSTSHPDVSAGTFGTLAKVSEKSGTITIGISNNHVWANSNKADKGDGLLQPGSYDSGESPDDKFGRLYDYIPIQVVGPSNCSLSDGVAKFLNGISKLFGRETRFEVRTKIEKNEVDAALGQALNQDEIAYYVLGPKDERKTGYKKLYHGGSREAEIGEMVWGSGRTLGYVGEETGAKVKSKDATIRVRYPGGMAVFKNQVHIASQEKFSAGGMSGTALAGTRDDKVIALLFAGNRDGTHTYANRIEILEEKLNAQVVDMKEME